MEDVQKIFIKEKWIKIQIGKDKLHVGKEKINIKQNIDDLQAAPKWCWLEQKNVNMTKAGNQCGCDCVCVCDMLMLILVTWRTTFVFMCKLKSEYL